MRSRPLSVFELQPSIEPNHGLCSARKPPGTLAGIYLALLLLLPIMAVAQPQQQQLPSTFIYNQSASGHSTQPGTGGYNPTQVFVVPYIPADFGFSFPGDSAPPCPSDARSQTLDKHGPQLPPLYSMSNFSVMGFARGNWPVVIDYLVDQDSIILVVIAPEGSPPLTFIANARKGHYQGKLTLPASLGDQPRVAQYLIQTLDATAAQSTSARVQIHGIAAGPKAVGSIGIDHVNFGPTSIHLAQHEKAQFSFHSISAFKNTDVTYVRLANYNREIVAAAVGGESTGSIASDAVHNGEWDGKPKLGKISANYPPELQKWLSGTQGEHVIQVRAWLGVEHGGDWVTALSDTMVMVN